ISNADYYLFTRDSRSVHVNGNPINGADPARFEVLNADFECTADARHAYYRNSVVAGADPSTFPPNRAVTRCDETSISFAE
ncbi:MAG: DKNYY domain-containing protein, partial [Mycobacterium sp.]